MNGMELINNDIAVIRELGQQLKEISQLQVQAERVQLWKDVNSLKRCRIPVKFHVEELCWLEILPDSTLVCEDEQARVYEKKLRRLLWQAKNLNDDWVYVDTIQSPHCINTAKLKGVAKVKTGETGGSYISRQILAIGDEPQSMIVDAHSTVNIRKREEHRHFAQELLGDTLQVEVEAPNLGVCPFDYVCEIMGQEEAFVAMVTDPVWFKEVMGFCYDFYNQRNKEFEQLGVLRLNNNYLECYNGGISYCDELPESSDSVKLKDLWGFTCAQAAVSISPQMHEHFVTEFDRKFLDVFGLNTIACCETIDHKMDLYRSIPHLRRISISEFNDFALAAQLLEDQYIYSVKPTGVHVSFDTWEEEMDRKYLEDMLQKSRGCHVEIINNTISTCRGDETRLVQWCNIAMELAHKYS